VKLKRKKIRTIVERVTQAVVEKQVKAEVDIAPDNVHISIKPWKPFEMKCPYKEG
jgi:hypothetical protein